MSTDKSLVNFGDLSKPATVLIERVSDAIGGIAKPWQIRRVARAEAEAQQIEAESRVAVSEIEERAVRRLVVEEGKRQENIENITYDAPQSLGDDPRPEQIDEDWITQFFDKARLVSDPEMQAIWARVLAGAATTPGLYSRRTVDWMSTMDKKDAEDFTRLCSYCVFIGSLEPLIYDEKHAIYREHGIAFATLQHLDGIGLIRFTELSGFKRGEFGAETTVAYCGYPLTISFPKESGNDLDVGKVMLTRVGTDLLRVCRAPPILGFVTYLIEKWVAKGLAVHSPVTNCLIRPKIPL